MTIDAKGQAREIVDWLVKSGFIKPPKLYWTDVEGKFAAAFEAVEQEARQEALVPLCIGQNTIQKIAAEGAWQSDDGRGVVAADDLFKQDPYERIAALEQELEIVKRARKGCAELLDLAQQRNGRLREALEMAESYLADGDYSEEPQLRELIGRLRAALAGIWIRSKP